MNPFTQATVATPLPPEAHPDFPTSSRRRPARRRRMAWRTALSMLAAAPSGALAVDVNTATATQLLALRGIGPRTAHIIVEERKRAGPYESLQDLSDRVRGIGPRKLAALKASGLKASRRYMTLQPRAGGNIPGAAAPSNEAAVPIDRRQAAPSGAAPAAKGSL